MIESYTLYTELKESLADWPDAAELCAKINSATDWYATPDRFRRDAISLARALVSRKKEVLSLARKEREARGRHWGAF